MTRQEKIIYSFILNIIDDEKPENIIIQTKKDTSKLLHRIEKTNLNSLFIAPKFNKENNDIYDLYIVMNDSAIAETDIGKIKNLISQKIVIFTDFKDDKATDTKMLKLGLQAELRDRTNKLKCFSYNLKNYNNKRSWNNPKGWANPENFDKFRW
tara:strand:+ start:67 stop:528 length:462 start_codon:yes stop_codon:yes gene_type:complete